MSADRSALLSAVATLARRGVEFVVVGTSGINFYARDASDAVVTEDVDVLLAPRVTELRSALDALRAEGFSFFVRDEPFVDFDDESILGNVLRARAAIRAEGRGSRIDLMLAGAGLAYEDLAADAVPFDLEGVAIRVGRLEKLLRSKELAGRAKDVEFLRMFAARFRDEAGRD